MTDVQVFLQARDILNRAAVPADNNGAWMSKEAYIAFGGSKEAWERRFGEDHVGYVTRDGV